MSDEPRRYLCERCGGLGVQEAGNYWDATKQEYVEMPKQACKMCDGTGELGIVQEHKQGASK